MLAFIGLSMIFWDSFDLPQMENIENQRYLSHSPAVRILGDTIAIVGSIITAFLDEIYQLPKTPRFSNFVIYNVFITINLITFGYFFGGNQFSFNPKNGVFGLFTQQNFVNVFYVSIMLGLNLIIANILLDKIFSQLIRNIASCFQTIITTFIYHIFNIQIIHSGISCLGYAFLIPGMMLIVGGQNYLQNKQAKINFLLYKQQEL